MQLRPVVESDLAVLERIDTEPALNGPFSWTGFRNPREHRRRWEQDGYIGDADALLVVEHSGAFAGFVVWRVVGPRRPAGCREIGIHLLPEYRGRGIGAIAQALLAEELFETTLINRVQAVTEVGNTAERRALERAGFREEGVLRGYGFVRGAWCDGVIYARLRDDPRQA